MLPSGIWLLSVYCNKRNKSHNDMTKKHQNYDARVRACAGAAESLHTYMLTPTPTNIFFYCFTGQSSPYIYINISH